MSRRKPKYIREAAEAAADAARDARLERTEHSPTRIPADTSQQAPHTSFGGVPLWYEDRTFRCVDCGREEIWTAEQQKWWYETAKGYSFSRAIRCRECRNARRDAHGGTPRRSHRDRREGTPADDS
ncbi:MAG: zinc-ribbon domain-containing protein [Planctomycetaceae bacterium]